MLLAMKTRNVIGLVRFDPPIVTAKQSFYIIGSQIASCPVILSYM